MPNRLNANESISVNNSIWSENSAHRLTMQGDGNLVLYQYGIPRWDSKTFVPNCTAIMRADGNLVISNSANNQVWESRTSGHPGASLIVQDDGNLVILGQSFTGPIAWKGNPPLLHLPGAAVPPQNLRVPLMRPVGGMRLWETGTATGRPFTDRLFAGEHLVPNEWIKSQSGSHNLVMQGDGNLVLYKSQGAPV
jgi:hypothetical protein